MGLCTSRKVGPAETGGSLQDQPTASQRAMRTFGGKGARRGQFNTPTGVAVSDEGEIFVADKENWRIQVFTLQGTFVRQFPTVISHFSQQVISPSDVALDGEGNVWVVGRWYYVEGTIAAFTGEQWAQQYTKEGLGLTDFRLGSTSWDTGVAVDTRRGYMLVTHKTTEDDECTHPTQRVHALNPYNGGIVRMIGLIDSSDRPKHITVNGDGNILVTNQSLEGRSCVYAYDYFIDTTVSLLQAVSGEFLFKFGGPESGEGQLNSPSGICTDKSGNIIVTNCDRMDNDVTTINRKEACVKMFDKTGRFLKDIATGLGLPCAVAMAPQGQLVVVDAADHKVIVFENY